MVSFKFTVLLCLLALCLSFVAAATPLSSVKAVKITTSKKNSSTIKSSSSSKKTSNSIKTSIKTSPVSVKTSSVSIKTTLKTKTTGSTSTHVPSATVKTTLQTKISSTSSSTSVPSSTLLPFKLTQNNYGESASWGTQGLYFTIEDPQTATATDCSVRWENTANLPPSNWTYCSDNTFTFKVTHFEDLLAWSYILKHQYGHDALGCVSPTDSQCITTVGHADIRINGNSGDSSVGEGYGCGGSGNCGAWDNDRVTGYIDFSCQGAACAGKV